MRSEGSNRDSCSQVAAYAPMLFGAGAAHPLVQALPPVLVMPLAELDRAQAVLEVLFAEAFAQHCGRQNVVDRLFEVVLILILRALMAQTWTLERMAACAGMSGSHFASVFVQVVGVSPGEYLAGYRIVLAQDLLRRGRPLKLVSGDVGYGSAAALSRAFRAHCGCSPREWKASQEPRA